MKYLPYYKKWMEKGIMPEAGLCEYFKEDELLELFVPVNYSSFSCPCFWGAGYSLGSKKYETNRYFVFTELRQTILLFMAAMNGEL